MADDLPKSVLDNLLEGCQVISPDYRYLYVNDALVSHGKTTREDLLGRRMTEAYPGIDRTAMFPILQRCMEERRADQMENEFTFPDGSKGFFELRFEPVPAGVAILSLDITQRKQAEAALQRTMRALRTLSECNQTLVRAVDERQFTRDVCRLVVESAGYGMAWIGLLDGEDTSRVTPVASAGLEKDGGESGASIPDPTWGGTLVEQALRSGQVTVAHRDEDEAQGRSWREDAPQHDFASCIVLPITERHTCIGVLTIYAGEESAFDDNERALLTEVALDLGYGIATLRARLAQGKTAAQLEEERARTRAIYDHLPHATFVWKHGDDGFTLVDFNETARAMTSGKVAELLGSGTTEREFGVPHLAEDLLRCAKEGGVTHREVDCLLPGAKQHRMVLTYGFIPPDMVLLHAEDFSELRRTEEQLVAAQRLEAVGRLAGGVAHDFNNMLSVILAHAEFLKEELHTSDPMWEDVEEIHEAGKRAAALTRQLLAFSRKQVLEPQVTNLNNVIEGIEGMLRRLLGEDISIEVKPAADLGNVMADPGQIEQVVMNLAVNARDAMPGGGKLTIDTCNVDLDEEYAVEHVSVAPGQYVRLSVSDNGTGMSSDVLKQIFEPFFTTKEKGKGTGLGLSTVYGIVKQSGGNIWTYSEPGLGTSFKIYLPRVDAPAIDHKRSQPAIGATGHETILVVEDEDSVRRATERILRMAGYRVLTAANGGEALLLCEKEHDQIDLLLTDVVMPRMSGGELADRLKELCPELKVLFTSGYTDDAILHHGVLESGTRFIGKPFSVASITTKVREVLDESQTAEA
jgi:PAS domain S-box-containing protein